MSKKIPNLPDLPDLPVPEDFEVGKQELNDLPPLPLDGGWGWFVVFGSFITNAILDSVCLTFGIYLIEFSEYFEEPIWKLSLAGSLIPGLYLAIGPFACALSNNYSCRSVSIVGSLVAATAFFISSFAKDVYTLIFTYGVFGGLGFAFMYLPSIVIVNFYFEKKRLKANAFTMCGSGIGTLIGAFLFDYLVNIYGWRGSLRIISGLVLNGIVCSCLYRPLEQTISQANRVTKLVPINEETVETEIGERGQRKSNTFLRLKDARLRTTSSGSLDGAYITKDNSMIKDSNLIKEILLEPLQEEELEHSSEPLDSHLIVTVETLVDSGNVTENGSLENIDELPEVIEQTVQPEKLSVERNNGRRISYSDKIEILDTSEAEKLAFEHKHNILKLRENGSNRSATSSECSDVSHGDVRVRRFSDGIRPMYRTDIFFSGSIPSLREYQSSYRSNDSLSYMSSNLSLPQGGYGKGVCIIDCSPTYFVLSQMFQFSILKSITFIILTACNILAMMGFFIPYVHIMQQVEIYKVNRFNQILLIGVMGGVNFLVRIIMGHSKDLTQANCILLHSFALIIGGFCTCMVPYIQKAYQIYVAYALVYGACIAVFVSLRSIVLVELLGLQKLTNSNGVLSLFQGLGLILGLPLAGYIYDVQQRRDNLFILAGLLLVTAGTICLPIRRIARYENSRILRMEDSKLHRHSELHEL